MMRTTPNMALPKLGRSYPDRSTDGKFRFRSLPITEAAADANSFVCEFNGVAGANEVGVGGGLSGADLVLTQYANPGSDGTYRTIAGTTFQSFFGTMAMYNAFATSPLGWACILRNRNISKASYITNLIAQDANGNNAMQVYGSAMNTTTGSFNSTDGVGAGISIPLNNAKFPIAGKDYMFVFSNDYVGGVGFVGIMVDNGKFPSSLSDFLFFSIGELVPFAGPSPITQWYPSEYKCILGSFAWNYGSNYSAAQTVKSLTLSKKPCFVLA
jgi:hypothetical protein